MLSLVLLTLAYAAALAAVIYFADRQRRFHESQTEKISQYIEALMARIGAPVYVRPVGPTVSDDVENLRRLFDEEGFEFVELPPS